MANTKLEIYVQSEMNTISPFLKRSEQLLALANQSVVTNQTEVALAVKLKREIVSHRTTTHNHRMNITRQMDAVTKQFIDLEEAALLPSKEAESVIKDKILTYEEEQERLARIESKRISQIKNDVAIFQIGVDRQSVTKEIVTSLSEKLAAHVNSIPEKDREHPDVNYQVVYTMNWFEELYSYVVERDRQAAEAIRLAEEAKVQSAARAKLEAEKAKVADAAAKVKAAQEKVIRDQVARDASIAKEKSDKITQVLANKTIKTGSREVTKFEIITSSLVPRELCTPDEKLIRIAVAAGVKPLGVRIWTETVNR